MTGDNMFSEGMPDMAQLLEQAQQMQVQVGAAQRKLAETVVEGTVSGGLVTAKVSGMGEVLGLDISPEIIDPDERETLADLIVAAIRDASARASDLAKEELGPLAGDGGPSSGMGPLGS